MPPKRRRAAAATPTGSEEQVFDIISISDSPRRSQTPDSSVQVTKSQVSSSRRRAPEQRVRGGSARRNARRVQEPLVPEVFREMLVEDSKRGWTSGSSDNDAVERAQKRRKGKEKEAIVVSDEDEAVKRGNAQLIPVNQDPLQDGDDDGGEESADDSDDDIAWEDVDLSAKPINMQDIMQAQELPPPKPARLELILDDPATRKTAEPRRKITAVERRIRLETHKLHLICLLYHVYIRSRWCNNSELKANLRPLLPEKAYEKLKHDPTDQQFRRSKLFIDGLYEAANAFRKKFRITRKGLVASHWQELEDLKSWSPPSGIELITKADFIRASTTLVGSRDVAAQLFCALLRSAGITARLVCSLQVLPFSFITKQKPQLPQQTAISISSDASDSEAPTPRRSGSLRRPLLRTPALPKAKPSSAKPETPESSYPVYWVEAWSIPSQKWITVDPLVTYSVAKPQLIEPPLSDPLNTLTYAIAIEDTGHAIDVTRRYAKFLSAKTRRSRVTSTKGGEKWYRKLLRIFHRGFEIDRDQLETSEFSQLMLDEPVPNNVQDLKDHPIFALKRHLKRGEIIWPERKVGTISTGRGRMEMVFRRQDVKEVKTREKWYKLGRSVDENEIPMKFTVAPRRVRAGRKNEDPEDEPDDEKPHQPLFALSQTTLYTPPPVTAGLVPKNRFGNLDIFVPSMIPAGGAHVSHALAARAAKLLGIDYSDAVTGFEFRNRQASAVIKGVVIASEYEEAVREVVKGFETENEKERERKKAAEALALWRRWLLRLRIRERLGVGTDEMPEVRMNGRLEDIGKVKGKGKGRRKRKQKDTWDEDGDDAGGGGFLVDSEAEEGEAGSGFEAEDGAGGFIADGDDASFDGGEGFVQEREYGGFLPDASKGDTPDDDGGGSFMPDDDGGGGFMPDDDGGGFMPDGDSGGGFMPDGDGGGGGFVPSSSGSGGFLLDGDDLGGGGGGFFQQPEEDEDECGGFLPDAADEGDNTVATDPIEKGDGGEDDKLLPDTMEKDVSDDESKPAPGEVVYELKPTSPKEVEEKAVSSKGEEEEEVLSESSDDEDPDWGLFGL
ncbi:Rad4-domain-containing protein [Wilcoxina mikolae CBS 423.85]|nr:Rad4-domain-containing protein [Wilcoxina mikolae CBS 423.85]